jgi:serine/threonine protein phosphatase PrpC
MGYNTYLSIEGLIMSGRTSFRIGDKVPLTLEDKYDDEQAHSEKADSYSIIGASVRGRLHHHNNIPRDDAFTVRFDGTWLAVAVADGAGSRSRSRYGASYLTNRLCSRLLLAARIRRRHTSNKATEKESQISGIGDTHLAPLSEATQSLLRDTQLSSELIDTSKSNLQDIVLRAFRNTRADLERFAFKHGVELDELHSTLLGLMLNTKTGEVGVGQIGDGLILGLDDKKEARLLAEPPTTGDPGASYFITQDDWEQYLYTQEIPGEEVEHFSTFYLMTDGVANDCQYGPPPDILKIWANDMDREIRLVSSLQVTAERLKKYLANYKAKGSFDDRTLVVIYRNNEERAT